MKKRRLLLFAVMVIAASFGSCAKEVDDCVMVHGYCGKDGGEGALRCEAGTVEVCAENDAGCLVWTLQQECGPNGYCTNMVDIDPHCLCTEPECEDGNEYCSDDDIMGCVDDGYGCMIEGVVEDCTETDQVCVEPADSPVCNFPGM